MNKKRFQKQIRKDTIDEFKNKCILVINRKRQSDTGVLTLYDIFKISALLKGGTNKMNYREMLINEIEYYNKKGYIPQLKIGEMTIREMEKIVDYCFTLEQNISFEEFSNNTNLGYYTNEQAIKKIIEKRKV